MQKIKLTILLVLSVTILFACSGGSSSGSKGGDGGNNNIAYLIGQTHGEMSGVVTNNIEMEPYDGVSTDRNIIIADPNEGVIEDRFKEGIRATYKAGKTIILEDATPTEINNLLEILGLNPSYKTGTNAAVALFAVEQIKGNNFYYVAANDDDADLDNLIAEPEQMLCETSDGTDAMYETQEGDLNKKHKSNKDKDDLTEEIIQENRMNRFMNWIYDEDGRMEKLESNMETIGKSFKKIDNSVDLKNLAEASSWDEDVSSEGQSFRINYTSYSCHSFKNDQDFYAIRQSAVLNPSNNWVKEETGDNCSTLAMQYGHMRRYIFKNYWNSDPGVSSPLRDHSPLNANGVTSLTSGVSFDISGNVGFKGADPTGGLSAGVHFSDSKTVNVQDVTVNDTSASTNGWDASWKYVFKDPDNGKRYFACSELNDAPLLSRSNFSPVNQWVWVTSRNFRKPDGKLSFKSEFEWVSGVSYGGENAWWVTVHDARHYDYDSRKVTMDIPLEQPPLLVASTRQIDFSKSGETKSFNIVSATPWTASCNQSWCEIQASSGSATDSSGQSFHVTAENNSSDTNREAILTLKSTTTTDVVNIKIFQSKF